MWTDSFKQKNAQEIHKLDTVKGQRPHVLLSHNHKEMSAKRV